MPSLGAGPIGAHHCKVDGARNSLPARPNSKVLRLLNQKWLFKWPTQEPVDVACRRPKERTVERSAIEHSKHNA